MNYLIIVISLFVLLIGLGVGYWFANFTKIRDLIHQKAQLKARVKKLEELVKYLEEKENNNE